MRCYTIADEAIQNVVLQEALAKIVNVATGFQNILVGRNFLRKHIALRFLEIDLTEAYAAIYNQALILCPAYPG